MPAIMRVFRSQTIFLTSGKWSQQGDPHQVGDFMPLTLSKAQLLSRLQDIEWDDFEVKAAAAELPKNIWETVSAFANTAGGWILLGISEMGKRFEVTGVQKTEKLEQNFTTTLRNREKFNAIIEVDSYKYEIEGNRVLGFYVHLSEHKPIYFSPMKPRIRVFDNRIEFENPGNFPRSVDELLRVDMTIPRNPVLARLFRCTKLCENAGYGFDKMLTWKKSTGFGVTFENRVDSCLATFWRVPMVQTTQKTTQKRSDVQIKILEYLAEHPMASRQELTDNISNITVDGIKYNLKKLQEKEFIVRIGPDKGGHWQVLKRN